LFFLLNVSECVLMRKKNLSNHTFQFGNIIVFYIENVFKSFIAKQSEIVFSLNKNM